jgi:hypothetical protein
MKDWKRFREHQSIELPYHPDLNFDPDVEDDVAVQRVAEAHEKLAEELAPQMKALAVSAEQPEDEGLAAGGGPEFDAIMYVVLSAMGAYVTLREVATDVRKVIRYLRSRARRDDEIPIPDVAIMLLAWDHVAPPNSQKDVELEYMAPVSRVNPAGYGIDKGWLVGFRVEGDATTVVVDRNGDVLGTTRSPDLSLVPPLKPGWESDTPNMEDD